MNKYLGKTLVVFLLAFETLFTLSKLTALAETTPQDIHVYKDSLSSNFENWSWKSTQNFSNLNPLAEGSKSIKLLTSPYGALYLHSKNLIDTNIYGKLHLAYYRIDSRQKYKLVFYDENKKDVKSYDLNTSQVNAWTKYDINLSSIGLGGKKLSGIAIQEMSGLDQVKIYLDDIKFVVTSTSPSSSESSPTPTPSSSPTNSNNTSSSPITSTGYSTSNGKLYKDGTSFKIKGVNWFGFEEDTHVVHGLWARSYKDMIAQMKTLGFNAVRIPVCPATLSGSSATSINYSLNSDLNGLNSLQILDKVMNELNSNKMYILLDHHRPDCKAISELPSISGYSETQWINDLKFMANRYKNLEYFIGIDLKNEPHGAASWGSGSYNDWDTSAEKAGKEILSVNSRILIFVEGVQENKLCSDSYGHWMGGNLNPVNCHKIQDSYIPANKLILSPHVYGPDVYNQSYFGDSTFPNNMPKIWDLHFGTLTDKGYTIIPGEWGGKYGNGGDPKDKTWQDALKKYMIGKKICNTFYWSWNPNSGDTGGILQDDWKTPWDNKVTMLKDFYNSCNQ